MADTIHEAVLFEIASREGVEPAELKPPLCDVIDPEAIDAVFTNTSNITRSGGRLEFEYAGYEISITAEPNVSVEKITEN